jgi:lipopolysaccharide biosynthesis glycosyltransferase
MNKIILLLVSVALFTISAATENIKVISSADEVKPIFDQGTTVVFACDNNYVYGLAVAIQSLMDNSSDKYNYDLWILDGGIMDENRKHLLEIKRGKKNFSIRFFDMNSYIKNYMKYFSLPGVSNYSLSIATYYRLFIPKIFCRYKKVIYLDCDLVVLRDIAELYHIDMKENKIGAVIDCPQLFNTRKIVENIIVTMKGKKYFNAGVLLFNIEKIDCQNFLDENLKFLLLFHDKIFLGDQDILNALHMDDVLFLDPKWNMFDSYVDIYVTTINKLAASEAVYIIHYVRSLKPWKSNNRAAYGDIWLEYAKKTQFYKDILPK